MSHDLEQRTDGNWSFVSAREPGWHQLGTTYADRDGVDLDTVLADLDAGTIIEVPVYGHTGNLSMVRMPGQKMTVRRRLAGMNPDGTEAYEHIPLGIVGDDYTVIDERRAFGFLDEVVDLGGACYETAMLLKGGTRAACCLRMPNVINVGGVDPVGLYLLLATSHDGSMSLSAYATPVRVVCQNTLTWGVAAAVQKWSVRHNKNADAKLNAEEARRNLALTFSYAKEWQREADELLKVEMTKLEFEKIVSGLYAPAEDAGKHRVAVWDNVRDKHLELWQAPTQANIAGTAWAGLNALTEYHDWFRKTRGQAEADQDTYRFERAITESASSEKNRLVAAVRNFASV